MTGSIIGSITGSGSGGGTAAARGTTAKLNAHLGQNLASGLQSWPHWPQVLPGTGGAAAGAIANVVPQEEQNLAPGLFSAWQERHFNWHLFSYQRRESRTLAIARKAALLPYG
nr:hypothetical protein [Janthinobacterium sp. FW305-129]